MYIYRYQQDKLEEDVRVRYVSEEYPWLYEVSKPRLVQYNPHYPSE